MKIGFIGLGNMGSGMANNILEKIDDKSNLFVYTRTPEKIAKMADKGAVGCSSLKEITTSVDILLTCLPNVETSRELFMNSGGICDYANSNQILVDHSTVDVKTSQDCFEFASKKGINFFMPLDIVTWNYIGVYNPHKLCGREHFHLFKGYG